MKDFLSTFLKPGSAPRFALGRVVATPGALALMHATNSSPFVLLVKHVTCDWGEIDPEDVVTNEDALEHGLRVLSVYRFPFSPCPLPDSVTLALGCSDVVAGRLPTRTPIATTGILGSCRYASF